MKKHFFITLFTFFATTWLIGQTLRQYEKAVDEAFAKKDYYAALYYLDIIQEIDSSLIDLQYKQAEAARNFNAYKLAEKRYKQVIASNKNNEFPRASFWLGHVQKSQGRYQEAINSFRYYLDSIVVKETLYIEAAQAEITSCEWAEKMKDEYDQKVTIEQLGTEVNTPYSEFAPFAKDDKLYFSSLRFPLKNNKTNAPPKLFSKVLSSTDNAPSEVVALDINDKKHTAHSSFSRNGDRLYFNICKYVDGHIIKCDLYYKEVYEDGSFGSSVKLPNYINLTGYTITQPSIGYNKESRKETLYYVSDRPGGKGGMDIWYSEIDEDGNFLEPVNFGLVNTEKDEASPFFHTNTRTFYFSSKGRKNLGGFDLFQVYIDDGFNWEEIEHIGLPLSTSYDDLYFSLNDYGDQGYFASNREGSIILEEEISACCNDIFKFTLETFPLDLTALTFNAETETALTDVNVQLHNITPAPIEIPAKKLPTGHKHFYKVKNDLEYRLIAQRNDFFPDTLYFNTEDANPGDRLEEKLYLKPLGLNVFVYDIKTNDPLSKVSIRLWELDGEGNKIREIALASIEDYQFRLQSNKRYLIVADKIGYKPSSLQFSTFVWEGDGPILEKELYLEEDDPVDIVIPNFEQFPLYFDNDSPDPQTLDTITEKTYPITLEEYERRKEIYRREYSKGLTGENRILAEAEIDRFFENEVKASYQQFDKFTRKVLERLRKGRSYTIQVQAYTSPLASKKYNLNLSKRRISSMYNYYKRFNNGEMAKYVENGAISFQLIPYGESKAPSSISDSPRDRRNSVFSPSASKERRVVILGVEKKEKESVTSRRNEADSPTN